MIRQIAGLALAGLASLAHAQQSAPAPTAPGEAGCHIAAPQAPAIEWRGSAIYRARAQVRAGQVVTSDIAARTPGVDSEAQRAMVQAVDKALHEARCPGDHEIDQLFIFNLSPGHTTVTSVPTPASAAAVAANEVGPPEHCRFGVEWTSACANGLADGEGRLDAVDADGQLFYRHEGRLRAGLRDGAGITTRADGSRVEGSFTNDRLTGPGHIAFVNGDQFDGEFRAGFAMGEGRLRFANGDSFTGQLRAGRMGKGVYRWADGTQYRGGFANNHPSGPGLLQFADGSALKARFTNGLLDGPARLTLQKGGAFEGEFEQGLLKAPKVDAHSTSHLRMKRLRVPNVAAPGLLSDSRRVALACTRGRAIKVPDLGWQGHAVFHAVIQFKDGQVRSVDIQPRQSTGDATMDLRYIEALTKSMRDGVQCTGDVRLERTYAVETR